MSIDLSNTTFHAYITDGMPDGYGSTSNYGVTPFQGAQPVFGFRFRADAQKCVDVLNATYPGKVADWFHLESLDLDQIQDLIFWNHSDDFDDFGKTHAAPLAVVSTLAGITFNNFEGEPLTLNDADAKRLADNLNAIIDLREVRN